ncbi:thiol:disulfide interchange protein DsbA/DsbL [Chitinimonas naiadis]
MPATKLLRRILPALFLAAGLHASAALQAGIDYVVLPSPQPVEQVGKGEVIEFFSFGCPHCQHYEPFVEAWAAKLPRDVVFRREHIAPSGRTDWLGYAKLFYALKMLGKSEPLVPKVFATVSAKQVELRDEDALFNWIANQGLDRKQFIAVYQSFGMQGQLNRVNELGRLLQVRSVPGFVVNGRYLVQVHEGDEDGQRLFSTINELLATDRAKDKTAGK